MMGSTSWPEMSLCRQAWNTGFFWSTISSRIVGNHWGISQPLDRTCWSVLYICQIRSECKQSNFIFHKLPLLLNERFLHPVTKLLMCHRLFNAWCIKFKPVWRNINKKSLWGVMPFVTRRAQSYPTFRDSNGECAASCFFCMGGQSRGPPRCK